jgi:hypothetical protein
MVVTDLFHSDEGLRTRALATLEGVPEHARASLAAKLIPYARDAATRVADATIPDPSPMLSRIVVALAHLRVESAKQCMLRLAQDECLPVKRVLARSLAGLRVPEVRPTLMALLSDDVARFFAIEAIRSAPFPEALRDLIELAEADDAIARVGVSVIAACARAGGPAERAAAADFLSELLDDEALAGPAKDALTLLAAV